jgi:ankyrin repeat protein
MNTNLTLFNLLKSHKWEEFILMIQKNENIDLNIKDEHQNYLINYAIIYNRIDVLNEIFKKRIRLDVKDTDGRTILYFPIKLNYLNVLEKLLMFDKNQVGISILEIKDNNGYSALHYSIIFDNFDAFQLLYKNDSNIESIDKFGNNSLGVAIEYKRIKFIEFLISKNVNLNHVNKTGETPIILALLKKQIKIIEILLETSLNLNIAETQNKITPLIIACNFSLNDIILKMMTKNVNYNHQDFDGNTALHYCAIENNLYIMNLLIDKTNTNLINSFGKTVLHLICEKINDNINVNDNNNINEINIIKKLIEKSNLNIQDNNGNTILHILAIKNLFELFQNELLNKKLDIFIKNRNDESPFSILGNKIIPIVSKSYFNILKENNEWSNDWENGCKLNLINENECINKINSFILENSRSFPIKKIHTELFLDNGIYVSRCSYVGSGIDLICGLIFLHNNFENLGSTLSRDFESNRNIEEYYESLGLVSSFKLDFLNFEIIWAYQKLFYSTNFDLVINQNLKLNKEFIIIPLGIEIASGSHANIIVWDVKNKIIERFEPFGGSYPNNFYYNSFLLDHLLSSKFLEYDDKITYKSPESYLPISSFQSLESKEDSFCSKIGDPNGFCAIWCVWWVYHKLNNKNISSDKLVIKLIKKIKSHNYYFRNIIRNFSVNVTKIRDDILSKFNLDVNDWINNNMTFEQYEKITNTIKDMIIF